MRAAEVGEWIRCSEIDIRDRTDWYWWWDEDPDAGPVPVHVQYSPTTKELYASTGQLGWNRSQDLKDMGGWWLPLVPPATPEG